MSQNIRRSYTFSFITAFWLTVLASLVLVLIEFFFFTLHGGSVLIFASLVLVFTFFITQYRLEHFVYKRIERLYRNVSLLASSPIQEQQVTTDMASLSQNVQKFAEQKKLEIEALKIREDYRKEFIGNVAHELKTPLFTIQGYILTLLDGAMDDEKFREKYLLRANESVDRLIYIVKDLDMITKLEAGELQLHLADFDVVEVIQTVFEMLELKAERKEISLTLDHPENQPVFVHADKKRILQVLSNLVINSIKYGKQNGTTELSITSLDEDKLLICVTDNGMGFKKEDISRIFERFFRLDKSGSREEGGSGLGLSIVKHILEAHHEKIYVESDHGVGSEFSFTLTKA